MYIQAEKAPKIDSHSKSVNRNVGKQTFRLKDNRADAIIQDKMKIAIDNSAVQRFTSSISSVLQLGRCIYCRKGKGHAPNCPCYKGPPVKETKIYTEAEARKKAEEKQKRMAATHHAKTGVPGTPSSRHETWQKEGVEDLTRRILESQEQRAEKEAKPEAGSKKK